MTTWQRIVRLAISFPLALGVLLGAARASGQQRGAPPPFADVAGYWEGEAFGEQFVPILQEKAATLTVTKRHQAIFSFTVNPQTGKVKGEGWIIYSLHTTLKQTPLPGGFVPTFMILSQRFDLKNGPELRKFQLGGQVERQGPNLTLTLTQEGNCFRQGDADLRVANELVAVRTMAIRYNKEGVDKEHTLKCWSPFLQGSVPLASAGVWEAKLDQTGSSGDYFTWRATRTLGMLGPAPIGIPVPTGIKEKIRIREQLSRGHWKGKLFGLSLVSDTVVLKNGSFTLAVALRHEGELDLRVQPVIHPGVAVRVEGEARVTYSVDAYYNGPTFALDYYKYGLKGGPQTRTFKVSGWLREDHSGHYHITFGQVGGEVSPLELKWMFVISAGVFPTGLPPKIVEGGKTIPARLPPGAISDFKLKIHNLDGNKFVAVYDEERAAINFGGVSPDSQNHHIVMAYRKPAVDISIERIVPIQVVEDAPLIKGKATMVRVYVKMDGVPDLAWLDVDVEMNFDGYSVTLSRTLFNYEGKTHVVDPKQMGYQGPLLDEISGRLEAGRPIDTFRHDFGVDAYNFEKNKAGQHFIPGPGSISAQVVGIKPSIEDLRKDNDQRSMNAKISKKSPSLSIAFFNVLIGSGTFKMTSGSVLVKIKEWVRYLEAVYPVKKVKVSTRIASIALPAPALPKLSRVPWKTMRELLLESLVASASKSLPGYDRYIFVVPDGALGTGEEAKGGLTFPGMRGAYLEEDAEPFDLAHELGHTYGLCGENEGDHTCPGFTKEEDYKGDAGWDVRGAAEPLLRRKTPEKEHQFSYMTLRTNIRSWTSGRNYEKLLDKLP